MKQGQIAALNMCGIQAEYTDRYAMKNTMNFYGLVTLSLGRGVAEEGDIVLEEEDAHNYRRAIIRDGKLDSILLQGKIDYSGIYQYLIKNQIDLSGTRYFPSFLCRFLWSQRKWSVLLSDITYNESGCEFAS